jgi:hypothetical protein
MELNLLDCVFYRLAENARLEGLSLCNDAVWRVSIEAIDDIETMTRQARSGTSGWNSNCIIDRRSGYDDDDDDDGHYRHQLEHNRNQWQQRLVPFARLKDLTIEVNGRSVAPLVALLEPSSSLTRLAITVLCWPGPAAVDAATAAAAIIPTLATLQQLQSLDLELYSYNRGQAGKTSLTPSNLHALQRLTQLRVLRLAADSGAADLTDADMAALLRAQPHLHTLAFDAATWRPWRSLLRAIGEACPCLRRLAVNNDCFLAPTFDGATCTPLFPQLHELKLVELMWDGIYVSGYVCVPNHISYCFSCSLGRLLSCELAALRSTYDFPLMTITLEVVAKGRGVVRN